MATCPTCGRAVLTEWPHGHSSNAERVEALVAALRPYEVELKEGDDFPVVLAAMTAEQLAEELAPALPELREAQRQRGLLLDAISLSMPALLEVERAIVGLEHLTGEALLALERAMRRLEQAYDEVAHDRST